MQRLLIASDFHTDINRRLPTLAGADVLVLAGDVGQLDALVLTIPLLCDLFPHIVYVAGNHEYYESSFDATHEVLSQLSAKFSNFHWLNNGTVTIEGQRYVGTTLWFPETPRALGFAHGFTDFRFIADMWTRFGEENTKAQKFLEDTVQPDDIVVTHHAPTPKSIHPQYKISVANIFYVCDMEHLIERVQPKLWVHGHMHTSVDVMLGDTRVLANPYGYESRGESESFNPDMIVEI